MDRQKSLNIIPVFFFEIVSSKTWVFKTILRIIRYVSIQNPTLYLYPSTSPGCTWIPKEPLFKCSMRPGSFLLGGKLHFRWREWGRFETDELFFGGVGPSDGVELRFVLRNWDASKKNNQSQPQLVRGIFFCQWWDIWWDNDSSSQLLHKAVPSNSHRFPLWSPVFEGLTKRNLQNAEDLRTQMFKELIQTIMMKNSR